MPGIMEFQDDRASDIKEDGADYDEPTGNPKTPPNQRGIHCQLVVSANAAPEPRG
jgi:hypothetical protein